MLTMAIPDVEILAVHFFRGRHLKLYKIPCRLNIRTFFFSQREVDDWISLPANAVEDSSVNMFKNRLDDYYARNGHL